MDIPAVLIPALLLLSTGLAALLWRERAMRQRLSLQQFALVQELGHALPVGLTIIDAEGMIVYANELVLKDNAGTGIAKSVGGSYEAGLRRAMEEGGLWHPEMSHDALLDHFLNEAMRDGYRGDFRFKDDSAFVRITRHLSSGHIVLIREDVSDAHARLREIEKLNRALQDRIRVANATNDELRAFAYAASHDLKSPTNTSMMLVDAIQEDLDGGMAAETEEMFDDLRATLDRMQVMIADVLDYTNTIGEELTVEPVSLDEVVAEALADLRGDMQGLDARVETAPLPEVQANRGQMRLLVNNLLSNAVKFRKPGTSPKIRIGPVGYGEAGMIGFFVEDDGIGIDPKYHERVFQLFQRLNPATVYEGTGMGLAICHRIAMNHGGHIDLRSAPGEGARFTVWLKERVQ